MQCLPSDPVYHLSSLLQSFAIGLMGNNYSWKTSVYSMVSAFTAWQCPCVVCKAVVRSVEQCFHPSLLCMDVPAVPHVKPLLLPEVELGQEPVTEWKSLAHMSVYQQGKYC